MHNYANYANPYCTVNSVALPPYPRTVSIPPPPPYPTNNTYGASSGTITASTGDIGQAFGNFQPNL